MYYTSIYGMNVNIGLWTSEIISSLSNIFIYQKNLNTHWVFLKKLHLPVDILCIGPEIHEFRKPLIVLLKDIKGKKLCSNQVLLKRDRKPFHK